MGLHALTPSNLEIRDNFDAIAPRYDLANRIISLGTDLRWRRLAANALRDLPAGARVLDLACGTCDMALAVLRRTRAGRVVGVDLSRTMLRLAQRKLSLRRRGGPADDGRAAAAAVDLVSAPAESLPFRDGVFDAVTIAFGIRNVPEIRSGLGEMLRVLRPGGRACILEFSAPPARLHWRLYNYYFFRVLPRLGGLLTGREAAYRYLTRTVADFPDAPGFTALLREVGFARVSHRALQGGIVCIHTGAKP